MNNALGGRRGQSAVLGKTKTSSLRSRHLSPATLRYLYMFVEFQSNLNHDTLLFNYIGL